jgi:hypothetical protein
VITNVSGYGGIYLSYLTAPVIDSNTVTAAYDGIDLNSCNGTLRIERNKINVVNSSGLSLSSCAATSVNPGLIANNFVSMGNTSSAYGIYNSSSSYQNIYYNSVYVGGTSTGSYAFYSGGGAATKVRNNIFVNNGGGMAYDVETPSAIDTSNYNDLFTSGVTLAKWGATTCANLAALVAASQKDSNSASALPEFASAIDLHLIGGVDSLFHCTPITGITTDIDGQLRSPTSPYKGADEPGAPLPITLASFTAQLNQHGRVCSWNG